MVVTMQPQKNVKVSRKVDGGHTWMNARAYLAETLRLFFRMSES